MRETLRWNSIALRCTRGPAYAGAFELIVCSSESFGRVSEDLIAR
jgi:hypothetical protein